MKAFSVVIRSVHNDMLIGAGIIDEYELVRLVNCEDIRICACHEVWRG